LWYYDFIDLQLLPTAPKNPCNFLSDKDTQNPKFNPSYRKKKKTLSDKGKRASFVIHIKTLYLFNFFFDLAKRFFIAGWERERAERAKREAGGARA
jgi:hypothetical protein